MLCLYFRQAKNQRSPKIDIEAIDSRISYLDGVWNRSDRKKRQDSVHKCLESFLSRLAHQPSISSCDPGDLLRFLVWKDSSGKTKVHEIVCPYLGDKLKLDCPCPNRLAAATVNNLVQKLVDIFDQAGRGRFWDIRRNSGNPACAPSIKNYGKQISLEQAKSHILPKQAKPIFIGKLRKIFSYIDNQLSRPDLSPRQRFVLMRDQAFLKIQFFAGDRASDLSLIPTQEVKRLEDNSGMSFCHTLTKTIRGGKGAANRFVIKRSEDRLICPIFGLERYIQWCLEWGVDLSCGYLFRVVNESGRVLNQRVTYQVMYVRFKEYLSVLGLDEGETPHSLRAGCAILLGMAGAVDSEEQMMAHVGWSTAESARYYTRVNAMRDAGVVAKRLIGSVQKSDDVESMYTKHSDRVLNNAFP